MFERIAAVHPDHARVCPIALAEHVLPELPIKTHRRILP